tara:strand:+ start:1023 stop:1697 length:675 start_codon:yes stop_codon:yes gene_type:complete
MFSILPLAIAMLISTQFGPVVAPFGSFDMSIHIDFAELERKAEEAKERDRQHQYALQRANILDAKESYEIYKVTIKDLKAINAILFRYKDSFAKIRDHPNENGGEKLRKKAREILHTPIYDFIPNLKSPGDIIAHVFGSLKSTTTDKAEKLRKVAEIIPKLKGALVFLRDYCKKDNIEMYQIIGILYNLDLKLAISREGCFKYDHHSDCETYEEVLNLLDKMKA